MSADGFLTQMPFQLCFEHQPQNRKAVTSHNYSVLVLSRYRVIQKESAILREMTVCVILSKKVHMDVGPILNGYQDYGKKKYRPSCEDKQQSRNK
jgi:hypothetical protein